MNDIGGYIVILIAVISTVVSMVQKSKKNEQQSDKPLSQPEIPKWIKEIFGELSDDKPSKQPEQPKQLKPVQKSAPKIKKAKPVYNEVLDSNRRTTQSLRQTEMFDGLATRQAMHTEQVEQHKNAEEHRRFDVKLDEIDDWQKAFVYSEIFRRKY